MDWSMGGGLAGLKCRDSQERTRLTKGLLNVVDCEWVLIMNIANVVDARP